MLHYRQVLSRNPALIGLNSRVCAVATLEHSQPVSMFLAAVKCKWSSLKSCEKVYLTRQGEKWHYGTNIVNHWKLNQTKDLYVIIRCIVISSNSSGTAYKTLHIVMTVLLFWPVAACLTSTTYLPIYSLIKK